MFKFYEENLDYNIDIENIIIDKNNEYTLNDSIYKNFLKINHKDDHLLKDKFYKMFSILKYENFNTFNKHLLGHNQYKIYLEKLKKNLVYCKNNINTYYFSTLPKRIELTKKITKIKFKNDNLIIPVYDHITHKTGRVKISEGYNFLVCQKEIKDDLVPEKGHMLIEIDFKSAEPSLLYSLLYQKEIEDVYSIFNIAEDRQKIKLAVISSIYGASNNKIMKTTGISEKEINNIKNILDVSNLIKSLENNYNINNNIKNIYGRHIYGNNNLINYWLQSSTADYALSCFNYFYDQFKINIKAIIHDAIIFSCEKKEYDKIKKNKKLFDPITNISLPIEIKIISENT